MRRLHVRHQTSDFYLEQIEADMAINPGRGWGDFETAVNVEVEPFGTTRPFQWGRHSPKADLGIVENGAFVEFDAPANLVRVPGISPRNIAIIPTAPDQPLRLEGLNPTFVKVRRHFWELWRTKAE